mmetsp:Transcript_2550/g.2898  ORF Transcript_2550/g.2898 Transcript_2550/m.2898 type:complete len:504 (+) Transcript_2550:161-1672(+)
MSFATPKLNALVVDTGALVRGENLSQLADNFYTLNDVIAEVRDKKTRALLERLPFTLQIREPSEEAVKTIVRFAKETGDLAVLSKPDIRVLALTYMLHVELHGGDQGLRQHPLKWGSDSKDDSQTDSSKTSPKIPDKVCAKPAINASTKITEDTPIAQSKRNSANPWKTDKHSNTTVTSGEGQIGDDKSEPAGEQESEQDWPSLPTASAAKVIGTPEEAKLRHEEILKRQREHEARMQEKEIEEQLKIKNLEIDYKKKETVSEEPKQLTSKIIGASDVYVDSAAVMDDGLGWINESNLNDALAFNSFDGRIDKNLKTEKEEEAPKVGCVTTDYAMQNVMLQMKLHVVSLEGRKVNSVRRFVLKCDACFKITKELNRLFCPACGNATLARLSYSIDANGVHRYHYKKNRRINTRGSKYSIPHEKSNGKNKAKGKKLLLREDQLLSGWWGQQARKKTSSDSMFGEHVTESFGLSMTQKGEGIQIGYGRQNRNSRKGRERRGKKKK